MSLVNTIVGTYVVKYPSAGIDQEISGHTPDQIKAELAGAYQELANAEVVVTPGASAGGPAVITFRIPSGSKNV